MTTVKNSRADLQQLARERENYNIPLVPYGDRDVIDESTQNAFYNKAEQYDYIQARADWWCINPQCKVRLPYGRYYYKFKGSRSYWNMRRYGVWDRCCKLCYFDHIVNPKTDKWKNYMARLLENTRQEFERAIEKQQPNYREPVRTRRR